MSLVNCVSEQLSFSVDLDDESLSIICHSGTLAAGHYTAHVLHKQDSQWLLCNDKAVFPINLQRLTINIAMCIFVSFFCCLFLFCCCCFSMLSKGLILFFSSGVTTLLMTPVTQVRFTCKSLQILWEEK